MDFKLWNLGDLTNYSPYAPLPALPEIADGELVVLAVDAPQWLLFKLVGVLQNTRAGAVAIPAPGGAVVIWSRSADFAQWDFIPEAAFEFMTQVPDAIARQEPIVTIAPSVEPDEPQESAEPEKQAERSLEETARRKPDVAIHVWTPSVNTFATCINDLKAPRNIVLRTPLAKETLVERLKSIPTTGMEFCEVSISEPFDINAMTQEATTALREKGIPEDSYVVLNVSGASKYLWKALENVAIELFRDCSFACYDVARVKRQVSVNGVDWRTVSFLNDSVPLVESQKVDVKTPEKKSDSEDDEKTLSKSEMFLNDWNFLHFFNGDPDAKKREIEGRQKLTRDLWNLRKLIVEPLVDPKDGSSRKISFQRAVNEIAKRKKVKVHTPDKSQFISLVLTDQTKAFHYQVDLSRKNLTFQMAEWTPSQITRYLAGGWFEEYVFLQLQDLKSNKSRNDLQIQINATAQGHELDVVAYDENRYYVLECKSYRMNEDDSRDGTLDSIEKLEEIVRKIKNDEKRSVIGVMVFHSTLPPTGKIVERIQKSRYVACLNGCNLPKLINTGRILEIKAGDILS